MSLTQSFSIQQISCGLISSYIYRKHTVYWRIALVDNGTRTTLALHVTIKLSPNLTEYLFSGSGMTPTSHHRVLEQPDACLRGSKAPRWRLRWPRLCLAEKEPRVPLKVAVFL